MAGVTPMQRRQDRLGGIIPGVLQAAGGIVGGMFGGPAGAAAGSKVGGMVGGALAEPNKQPVQVGAGAAGAAGGGATGAAMGGVSEAFKAVKPQPQVPAPAPAPQAPVGQSSPGSAGAAMQRRMAESDSQIAQAQEALKTLPPEYQQQYGPTIQNAMRYERAARGY